MSVMGCRSVTDSVSISLLSVPSWHEKPSRGGLVGSLGFSRRHDLELEAAMGLAKRQFDPVRRLGAGKDKPKIPGPLRKGYQVLPRMGGDGDLVDPENGPRLHLAADLLQDPCPGDRNHHHTCRPPLAL